MGVVARSRCWPSVPKRLLPSLLLLRLLLLSVLLGPTVTFVRYLETNVGNKSLQTFVIEVHTISVKHVFIQRLVAEYKIVVIVDKGNVCVLAYILYSLVHFSTAFIGILVKSLKYTADHHVRRN